MNRALMCVVTLHFKVGCSRQTLASPRIGRLTGCSVHTGHKGPLLLVLWHAASLPVTPPACVCHLTHWKVRGRGLFQGDIHPFAWREWGNRNKALGVLANGRTAIPECKSDRPYQPAVSCLFFCSSVCSLLFMTPPPPPSPNTFILYVCIFLYLFPYPLTPLYLCVSVFESFSL